MATVYGNAYITIAATSSRDFQEGIFIPRISSAKHHVVWPLKDGKPPEPADTLCEGKIYARSARLTSLAEYPLQKRGWALQEHILPRRATQYITEELYWYCEPAALPRQDRHWCRQDTKEGKHSTWNQPSSLEGKPLIS